MKAPSDKLLWALYLVKGVERGPPEYLPHLAQMYTMLFQRLNMESTTWASQKATQVLHDLEVCACPWSVWLCVCARIRKVGVEDVSHVGTGSGACSCVYVRELEVQVFTLHLISGLYACVGECCCVA